MKTITEEKTILAYHGTSKRSKKSILLQKKFIESNKDSEWAGTGVYFFVDGISNPFKNAQKWGKYIKNLGDNATVLSVDITLNYDSFLDLTNAEQIEVFQQFREKIYKEAIERAKIAGKEIDWKYEKQKQLDCIAINLLSKQAGCHIVKRDAYINFEKYNESNCFSNYPSSNIPNCTILCLRKQSLICEWRDEDVRKIEESVG